MRTRLLTSLAAAVVSVGMLLLGGSPASANDNSRNSRNERPCCPTFIINNSPSLLSGNSVILDLLDLLTLGGGGNFSSGGDNGGGGNNFGNNDFGGGHRGFGNFGGGFGDNNRGDFGEGGNGHNFGGNFGGGGRR